MVSISKSKTLTLYVDNDLRRRLESMAETIDISRNRMAVNLLIIGLDETEKYRLIVKMIVFVRNLKDRLVRRSGVDGKSVEVWEKPGKSGTMTIYLEDDIPERLQKLAGMIGIKRNRLAVNLLDIGLEEAERLRAVGLIQAGVFARKLREGIRERLVGTAQEA